jgi:hypothetical protein
VGKESSVPEQAENIADKIIPRNKSAAAIFMRVNQGEISRGRLMGYRQQYAAEEKSSSR